MVQQFSPEMREPIQSEALLRDGIEISSGTCAEVMQLLSGLNDFLELATPNERVSELEQPDDDRL